MHLANDRTIDITTIGRSSGLPRRIETWFYRVDDQIYLTGSPGRRDWYANLLANPDFTFHLKQSIVADLPARATPITDPEERRADLRTHPLGPGWNRGSGGLVGGEPAGGGALQRGSNNNVALFPLTVRRLGLSWFSAALDSVFPESRWQSLP